MRRLPWAFSIVILLGVMLIVPYALAAPQPIGFAAPDRISQQQQTEAVSDETCLACHSNPALEKKLYNGESWSLYVNPEDHANSVHGEEELDCVQCHTDFDQKHNENPVQFPGFNAVDRRDASLKLVKVCQQCHTEQHENALDSVHGRALETGNVNAAICTDCHGSHTVQRLNDPATGQLTQEARLWIPQTCAKCHSTIHAQYTDSVHGAALTDGNPDVPTCIDCHGVHNIGDPTTAEFRLKSPEMCAKCHTDPAIMDKYGISTQVLNTYVADFHGSTVTLFEKQSPDAETNKPVCYDCHGVHDIAAADDPQKGLLVKENILKRCQVCHPTATENFSDAWLSHYIPSPDKYPLVYYVNVFYAIFIPGVLIPMAILVALDVSSVARRKLRAKKNQPRPPAAEPADAKPTGKESSHD